MGAPGVAPGSALHLVASYPADGQGTNAAPDAGLACDEPTPDCPVPTNLALELRFDRFLLPGGGLAAGVKLYTGSPANSLAVSVAYDLLERVVVLRPARQLHPNTLYTVEIASGADRNHGFWAFDGEPLEEGPVPLRFGFTTGSGPIALPAAAPVIADTCETMTQGPLSSCASCHVTRPGAETIPPSKYPPMGLDLSSSRGLFDTAIAHVAHQSETGSSAAGEGLRSPVRFGVQMNLVDPGSPATSYLMYKLLQKPQNFQLDATEASCPTGYHSPVAAGGCTAPDAAERARVREWFVRGDPMPEDQQANDGALAAVAVTHASLVRVAAWIAAGAPCPDPGALDPP